MNNICNRQPAEGKSIICLQTTLDVLLRRFLWYHRLLVRVELLNMQWLVSWITWVSRFALIRIITDIIGLLYYYQIDLPPVSASCFIINLWGSIAISSSVYLMMVSHQANLVSDHYSLTLWLRTCSSWCSICTKQTAATNVVTLNCICLRNLTSRTIPLRGVSTSPPPPPPQKKKIHTHTFDWPCTVEERFWAARFTIVLLSSTGSQFSCQIIEVSSSAQGPVIDIVWVWLIAKLMM
jgi:hypothetical protein